MVADAAGPAMEVWTAVNSAAAMPTAKKQNVH